MRKIMHREVSSKSGAFLNKPWQLQAIKKALERATSKEAKFVDHADVIRWLKTW